MKNKAVQLLLDRDKPKRPVMIVDEGFDMGMSIHICCPTCKQTIVNVWSSRTYNPLYCHYCGQRLDWSDENEER